MGTIAELEEIDFEKLGKRLKKLRKKEGLTQGQVAEDMNVTSGYVSNVENNHTAMSIRFLSYYGKMSGLTLDNIIDEIDTKFEPDELDLKIFEAYHKLSLEKRDLMNRMLALWLENRKPGSPEN